VEEEYPPPTPESPVKQPVKKLSLNSRIKNLANKCTETKGDAEGQVVIHSECGDSGAMKPRTYKKIGLAGKGGSCKVFKVRIGCPSRLRWEVVITHLI
jgi:hypothetical protein